MCKRIFVQDILPCNGITKNIVSRTQHMHTAIPWNIFSYMTVQNVNHVNLQQVLEVVSDP
jgi:hypothetical protein